MRIRAIPALTALAVGSALALSGCAPVPVATPAPGAKGLGTATVQGHVAEPAIVEGTGLDLADEHPDEQAAATEPAATLAPAVPTAPAPTPEPEPAAPAAIHREGDSGEGIRALQHRLAQLGHFDGAITPNYGPKTRAAVESFQSARGLRATGEVDAETLAALESSTETPTHDQMYNVAPAGPALYASGSSGDEVKRLQARLQQIQWYDGAIDGAYGAGTSAAVQGFQQRRNLAATGDVDQRTLDELRSLTTEPTDADLQPPAPEPAADQGMRLDSRCLTGRAICVSKAQRKLAWVVNGKIQMTMDARFGSADLPTAEGAFSVGWKSRDHVSTIYHSPMPFALFFHGGQAVHYSPGFAEHGYNGASHGCVNVRDRAAAERLFDLARVGDKVIVTAD